MASESSVQEVDGSGTGNMKRKQLLIGIIVGVVTSSVLQFLIFCPRHRFGGPPRDAQDLIARFTDELSLSEEQVRAIRPPLEDFHQVLQESRRGHLEKVRSAMDALDTKVVPLLDAAQVERLKKMRARFDRLKFGEPGGGPPPIPVR